MPLCSTGSKELVVRWSETEASPFLRTMQVLTLSTNRRRCRKPNAPARTKRRVPKQEARMIASGTTRWGEDVADGVKVGGAEAGGAEAEGNSATGVKFVTVR